MKTRNLAVLAFAVAIGSALVVRGDVVSTPSIVFSGTSTNTLTISGLTASRLVLSDGSKALASNAAITTNALAKSASSGASLATSAVSDDGTNVTVTEPFITSKSRQGNETTFALTSGAAAATFVKVAIPSNSMANLLVEYVFEVQNVGNDQQAFGGVIGVNAVNKGGTITCTVGVPTTATQPALAASSGTLTNAITCADATGGVMNILATDTTSLTATVNRIRYRVRALAPTTLVITAQ